jgi:uncharacterized integral membrane protein (TIGR00698 family)
MPSMIRPAWRDKVAATQRLVPGLAASCVIALAASYLSEHYGGPPIIFALLLGMAMHSLCEEPRYVPGIDTAGKTLLRFSVALLGLRVTFDQIMALGWITLGMVVAAVGLTIGFGLLLARLFRLDSRIGVLSGGAVGICGASAAMAIAVAWPRRDSERETAVTIACVTSLSTVAMTVYPALAAHLGFSDGQAGRLFGGAIHDVAQVVGAGFTFSPSAGETATIVKLMRVALLLPVVSCLALSVAYAARRARLGIESGPQASTEGGQGRPPLVPSFLIGFILLAGLNSLHLVPPALGALLSEVSRWLLIIAVAALGMKTSARDMLTAGRTLLALTAAETFFILALVLGWIALAG